MSKHNFIFAPGVNDKVTVVHYAGQCDTSSPRHHAKDSGFLFEYILSGEEIIESPELLIKAGIGDLVIIHPSEECVLYKDRGTLSVITLHISGFVLEAVSDVLGLPRIFAGSSGVLDKFIGIDAMFDKYSAGDGDSGRKFCELALSLLLEATVVDSEASTLSKKPSASRIKDHLDMCICGDVDLDSLGKKFGISGMHAIRLFRTEYDITPMQYLRIKRLEKSAELLSNTAMSIKDISSLLRFSSTQHFTNLFREHFGISPGKFRDNSLS